MEEFDIDRRFRTIFIVSSSFILLPDRAAVRSALERMFRHLQPSGRILISLEIPAEPSPGSYDRWHTVRTASRSGGATIRCQSRVFRFDTEAQVYETSLLFQLMHDGQVEHEEERPFLLRWYTEAQFTELLEEVGFTAIRATRAGSGPLTGTDRQFILVAERPVADA
jgi:hypothetical protein